MADWSRVLRKGMKLADKITKSLQGDVIVAHMSTADEYGKKTLLPAVPLLVNALIDSMASQQRSQSGTVSTVMRTRITFLDVAGLLAATNNEGLGIEDLLTLPDGSKSLAQNLGGFIDVGTGRPFATEVVLG